MHEKNGRKTLIGLQVTGPEEVCGSSHKDSRVRKGAQKTHLKVRRMWIPRGAVIQAQSLR
jgi:hypothetical protein